MKSGICKLIPLALMITAVACWMAPTAAPQGPPETPAIEPAAGNEIHLTYSLANAPAEIEAIAEALGVERIAYVRPGLYTRGNADRTIRTFNREKSEKNLEAIKAICDGAVWIITDIEKKHRRVVRHPKNYTEAEVKEAVEQYVACWSWFRSHWPNALLFEWNLSNAREAGVYIFAEELVLEHLDGFAVSLFWRDKANWRDMRERIVAHANTLVAPHDKIVIAGIGARYKIKHEHGVTEFAPVSREVIDAMIEIAFGGDVVFLWSNAHKRLPNPPGSENVLTERLKGIDDPLAHVNAHMVLILAEMRLKAAETEVLEKEEELEE